MVSQQNNMPAADQPSGMLAYLIKKMKQFTSRDYVDGTLTTIHVHDYDGTSNKYYLLDTRFEEVIELNFSDEVNPQALKKNKRIRVFGEFQETYRDQIIDFTVRKFMVTSI